MTHRLCQQLHRREVDLSWCGITQHNPAPDFCGPTDVQLDHRQQLLSAGDVQGQAADWPARHTAVGVLACGQVC